MYFYFYFSDLVRKNRFLSKEICESYLGICKPVLKLDFTAHGIMESL
jgi:hypothetical protein